MERVIDCPICFNQDKCFEDILEGDGKTMKSYLCINCGYTSNSYFTEDSRHLVEHRKSTAKIVNDLEIFDSEREIFWYPSVINMGKLGIIFPEGSMNNWNWKYAKVNPVPKGDEEKYPVEGEKGKFHTSFLDLETASVYDQFNFLDALRDMGIVKDM